MPPQQPPYGYPPPKRRPSAWWFVPGVLSLVLAAVALGGIGLIATITIGVLYFTRRPRGMGN